MEVQFDRAIAVVPSRVLAIHRDDRHVTTDTITNVLRTYRKHLDLSDRPGLRERTHVIEVRTGKPFISGNALRRSCESLSVTLQPGPAPAAARECHGRSAKYSLST
jgi:hypothetical protein